MASTLRSFGAPGAGVNLSITVPTGEYWMIKSIRIPFASDANVADRKVVMQMDDGGTSIFWRAYQPVLQPTSLSGEYVFGVGLPQIVVTPLAAGDLLRTAPIPHVILHPGYRFRAIVASLQATDAFGVSYAMIDISSNVHRVEP